MGHYAELCLFPVKLFLLSGGGVTIETVARLVAISIRRRELRDAWESWFRRPGAKRPKRFFARHSGAAV
jgi:hypothetical protein